MTRRVHVHRPLTLSCGLALLLVSVWLSPASPRLLGFPHIEIEPSSLGIDVNAGSIGTTTFVVRNIGTGVLFVYTIEDDVDWMSEDPVSFQVPALEAHTVTVTVDATSVPVGIYNQTIAVSSNDPDTPIVTIPIRVHVTDPVSTGPWEPERETLHGLGPNPFSRMTTIRFRLARSSPVGVTVHDSSGRAVATLARGSMSMGSHEVRWAGTDDAGKRVAPGAYWIRVHTDAFTRWCPAVLLP